MNKSRKTRASRKGLVIGPCPGEDSISNDGEAEIRNELLILHEPLASRMIALSRRTRKPMWHLCKKVLRLLIKQEESAGEQMIRPAKGTSKLLARPFEQSVICSGRFEPVKIFTDFVERPEQPVHPKDFECLSALSKS